MLPKYLIPILLLWSLCSKALRISLYAAAIIILLTTVCGIARCSESFKVDDALSVTDYGCTVGAVGGNQIMAAYIVRCHITRGEERKDMLYSMRPVDQFHNIRQARRQAMLDSCDWMDSVEEQILEARKLARR